MLKQLFNIQFKSKNKHYECSQTDSILEAGLRHGLAIHHECSNGTCGVCKAKLIKGDIKQLKYHDFHLSKDELANAEFLMCCHTAASDIQIELDLIGDVKSIPIQQIETKVKEINFLNDNIALVKLRTPRSKTLQFMAGQSVILSFNGNVSQYPLSSCPCQMMELEFHISNIASDSFAKLVFSKSLKVKSKVTLEGPKGVFVLKESSTRPMLFIAWDNGFAPIRSLIEHAFSLEMSNPVHFYWGYPAADTIPYLNNHAKSWHAVIDEYTYTPIACEFNRSGKNNYQKLSQQIFDTLDLTILKLSQVYIAAPAEMLIYLGELLLENGLNESQLIASPI